MLYFELDNLILAFCQHILFFNYGIKKFRIFTLSNLIPTVYDTVTRLLEKETISVSSITPIKAPMKGHSNAIRLFRLNAMQSQNQNPTRGIANLSIPVTSS